MARLELTDRIIDAVVKMTEGNIGAVSACVELARMTEVIDPQCAMGGIGKLMMLDTYEIYGSDIYILWSDICDRDIRKMIMLLRATQLGFFSHIKLKKMASEQSRNKHIVVTDEEFAELDKQVCERLEHFQRPEKVTT